MNKILIIALLVFVPFSSMAQASGGQIKRKTPQKTMSKMKSPKTPQRKKIAPTQQLQAVTNRERTKSEVINCIVNNMVYVEGGSFYMGGTIEQGSDRNENEMPAHEVTVSAYYIGKYEVTIEEWNSIMDISWTDHSNDHKPIRSITWNQCQVFINKLNSLTGKKFRLPTEAEWEFAARGGIHSRNYKYSGSNNYNDVVSTGKSDVGSKKANELGLYDMSGSVWEWCQDRYGSYSSSSHKQHNPTGPTIGDTRVIRGGGFFSLPEEFRVSQRIGYGPNEISSSLGFRLAL